MNAIVRLCQSSSILRMSIHSCSQAAGKHLSQLYHYQIPLSVKRQTPPSLDSPALQLLPLFHALRTEPGGVSHHSLSLTRGAASTLTLSWPLLAAFATARHSSLPSNHTARIRWSSSPTLIFPLPPTQSASQQPLPHALAEAGAHLALRCAKPSIRLTVNELIASFALLPALSHTGSGSDTLLTDRLPLRVCASLCKTRTLSSHLSTSLARSSPHNTVSDQIQPRRQLSQAAQAALSSRISATAHHLAGSINSSPAHSRPPAAPRPLSTPLPSAACHRSVLLPFHAVCRSSFLVPLWLLFVAVPSSQLSAVLSAHSSCTQCVRYWRSAEWCDLFGSAGSVLLPAECGDVRTISCSRRV